MKAIVRLDGEAVLSVELKKRGGLEYRGTDAELLGWFHWVLENEKDLVVGVGAGYAEMLPIRVETFTEFVNEAVLWASRETGQDYWWDVEDQETTPSMEIPEPPEEGAVF